MELHKRKNQRLKDYDYGQPGTYFITICTRYHKEILSQIVRDDSCDPIYDTGNNIKTLLLPYGKVVNKYIGLMNSKYTGISIDKYAIMPNHIHLIISIKEEHQKSKDATITISKFVSLYKRYCNKEIGEKIWQRSFYDHIIRGQTDYNEIYEYVNNNPLKWYITHNS